MSNNYKLLIRDCKRKRSKELDLSSQEITIVPEETFTLTFIKTLNLSNNGISLLDDRIAELNDLERIDLRNNLLQKFPFILLKLPKLKTVLLSGNQFSEEFSFLGKTGENLDNFREQLTAIFEKSQKSFKEDFFSDDDIKPKQVFVSKAKPLEKSPDAHPAQTSDDLIRSLKAQISTLTTENENLREKSLYLPKSFAMAENSNDLPMDIQIKNIGELQLIEKLSQGGFSIIEKGVFRSTTVAVKHFFDPSRLSEVKEEFLNEAKMLNKLRHPNIITLMGYHFPPNGLDNFLVFEYLPRGNLYETLHVKRVKIDKRALLMKLAEAINYMHLSGVCHRDLKSLNVMLTSDGMPKLIDFGLAKNFKDLNSGSNKYAATAAYSAPELFLQKEITPKTDVYAFGVLVWEVLNEDVPFRSMQMNDIKKFVLEKNILSSKGLSTASAEIIKSCCAFSPEARPSFAEVIKLLEKALG